MQSSVTKLVRGLTATVFVFASALASAGLAQDANAARRTRNFENVQWYYDSSPFAGSEDGRFDAIPPSANGG
jgi:hypothetical protein